MNQKTAKLIRKASLVSGVSYSAAKSGWNETPKNKRNGIRKEMQQMVSDGAPEPSFRLLLLNWRISKKLVQKEAAAFLGVPFDTYRNWEYGVNTPTDLAVCEITRRMETPTNQ